MNIDQLSENIYQQKIRIENPGMNTEQVVFNPATAMLIFEIVTKLVKCMRDRNSSKNVVYVQNVVQKPGFIDIIRLKRIIRKAIGYRRYRSEGKSILQSVLRTGGTLTLDDIANLLERD